MGKKWSRNQVLNIVLNAKGLIEDIRERAKENQKKSEGRPRSENSNKKVASTGATLSKPLTPTKQNREIAKLTGVSERTVHRTKRVKKENPEVYKRPFIRT